VFLVGRITRTFNLAFILFVSLALRGLIFLAMPTFPELVIFTALTLLLGAVNAFPLPIMNSILTLHTSEQEQGEVLGISSSVLSISNAIGPALAGVLVSLGYGTPFYLAGLATVATAGLALRFRQTLRPS
jgi:predicted MFS family arabinose efflux permease